MGCGFSGIEGETRFLTIDFTVVPTQQNTTLIEWWVDIGGGIGQLYRRPFTFEKGQGVPRTVTFTQMVFTLDTWATNGALSYVRANGNAEIYDIRYVIKRDSVVVP